MQRLKAQRAAGEITTAAFDQQVAAAREDVAVAVDADDKRLLDLRYAGGEIDAQTYDDILTMLIDSARDGARDTVDAPANVAVAAPAKPKRSKWRIAGIVVGILLVLGVVGNLIGMATEKPVLPVGLSSRASLLGSDDRGWVMKFHNQIDRDLVLSITIKSKNGDRGKGGTLLVPKYGTKEIGWMEGWQFRGGESIEIQHPDYETAIWTFK
jgi:hypothetical protein